MERLEPILKQKFWILLGIGMVMTLYGWWSETSRMARDILGRKAKIKAAIGLVPTAAIPNESWSKNLQDVNSKQVASIKETQADLFQRQVTRKVLPPGMNQTLEFGSKISNQDRDNFRDIYRDEVRKIWKKLDPMDFDGSGIVQYPISSMFALMNKGPWPEQAPTADVIWEAMEDLWLLEGLFQSIAMVNGPIGVTRTEASIHQIDKLDLRGGSPKKPAAAPVATSNRWAMVGGAGGATQSMGEEDNRSRKTRATGPAIGAVTVEFDPKEELGDDSLATAPVARPGEVANMGELLSLIGRGNSGGKGGKRYVLDDPNLPYKTRGFYLVVKMDHRKIPQLVAELTANENLIWPIEILRVQMARVNEDDGTSAAGGFGGMGGQMGPPRSGAGLGMGQEADFVTDQSLVAQSLLANALSDPNIATVALCGVMTLYNKVDLPAPPKTEATIPTSPNASATPDTNITANVGSADKNAEEGDSAAATVSVKTESVEAVVPADPEDEMTETQKVPPDKAEIDQQ